MIIILRDLWCALRGHPYPVSQNEDEYQAWLLGNVPFAPESYCSNCGACLSGRRRGMHS